ncbi:MAG TPA: hypothetical protein VEY08_08255, partial [Chloroflexia bacterium]|nr:hypothetical protein [Chloroflexia bacterium]
VAGGDMPPRIADHLAAEAATVRPPASGMDQAAVELPHLDYAMPHAEAPYRPEAVSEELFYPAPGEADDRK